MDVAITGGTGFIGSRLAAAHLARGDRVRLLTRRAPPARPPLPPGASWCAGDLRDPAADLAAFAGGADVLYHCAGVLRDPRAMAAVHVGGTRRLLEAAEGRVGRWVQLSSVGVYGPRRDGEVTEESPIRPVGPYEVTKAAADDAVGAAHARGRIVAATLRPSIVFGPGMPNGSLRALIRMVERRLFFFVGPPGASANYVPAESVVEALMICGAHPAAAGAVFNLSDHATLEEFVGWIAEERGVAAPRARLPEAPVRAASALLRLVPGWPLTPSRVAALTTRARYPATRLERTLGFRPTTGLERAVRALARAGGA